MDILVYMYARNSKNLERRMDYTADFTVSVCQLEITLLEEE